MVCLRMSPLLSLMHIFVLPMLRNNGRADPLSTRPGRYSRCRLSVPRTRSSVLLLLLLLLL